jgi:hypothetical protein
MSVFATVSAMLDRAGATRSAAGSDVPGLWRVPASRIAVGGTERVPVRRGGGERRFSVALVGGQVYTVDLQTVPRGVPALLGLYAPAGELIGSEGAWSRVRLVLTAPATGIYTVAADVAAGGDAFVLRVQPWTRDEVARAIEDPLYVL